LLGFDPYYVANEGRLVAFVPDHEADRAAAVMRRHPAGAGAVAIGRVRAGDHMVVARNAFGTTRVLDMLSGEQLPRIC
jgi:hydrogenase expression/formation protein HypE